MAKTHDKVADQIAGKEGGSYNRGQGPDINTGRRAIEVETENTVNDGLRQLQGFRKPVYIAGATRKATANALEATRGTTVGVMDQRGKVVRRATRRGR